MEPNVSIEPPALAGASSVAQEGRQLMGGLFLSALFGLGLGARMGGLALLEHALGVPAGLCAMGLLGVPPLYVLLTLFDAPISLPELASGFGRALGSVGAVLGGLAPVVAWLGVTIESPEVAAFVARLGLALSCAIGGAPLLLRVFEKLGGRGLRLKGGLLLCGFALFAGAVSARTWQALLPILGVCS
ncbi:MAG: hypothetical protein M3020_10350 [Myxococcota bacterium]|jgi:hypothetical protein|nr:hypothetical protein [Myxococcota bacterium]